MSGGLTAAIRRRSGLCGVFGRVRVGGIASGLSRFVTRVLRPVFGPRAVFADAADSDRDAPLLFPACLDLVPDHRQSGFGHRRSRLLRHCVKGIQKGLRDRLGPARQTGWGRCLFRHESASNPVLMAMGVSSLSSEYCLRRANERSIDKSPWAGRTRLRMARTGRLSALAKSGAA